MISRTYRYQQSKPVAELDQDKMEHLKTMKTIKITTVKKITLGCVIGVASLTPAFAQVKYNYSQSSGQFSGGSLPANTHGYSGNNNTIPIVGRNNPAAQSIPNTGPIPQGTYNVSSCNNSKGPNTAVLTPAPGTATHGRSGFLIHGNNSQNNASQGCIVVPPQARQTICNQVNNGQAVQVKVKP